MSGYNPILLRQKHTLLMKIPDTMTPKSVTVFPERHHRALSGSAGRSSLNQRLLNACHFNIRNLLWLQNTTPSQSKMPKQPNEPS
jgi:hypothetical protein